MHPRNPYKSRPPDFKELAIEYPDFRKHCQYITNGKIKFDFQNDEAVRCLTQTLLRKDFGLEVELPAGNLVPRIPQKLNYCLLIEDLLKENCISGDVVAIDIGTGTSCVHALIGARQFGWKFVATDGDEKSVRIAHENVARNGLEQEICVVHVNPNVKTVLMDVMNTLCPDSFTFCMCNPPFFEKDEKFKKFCEEPSYSGGETFSNRMAPSVDDRPAPHSTTFASSAELSVEGGEVGFVNRIIDDSVCLRERIKIYTTMLGRKQSIKPLAQRLQRFGDDVKYVVSPLNQGKTKRWMLAWTFSKNIDLAGNLQSRPVTLQCPAPGLTRLTQHLKALNGIVRSEDVGKIYVEFKSVTWTNLRARRRAEAELLGGNKAKRTKLNACHVSCEANLGCGDGTDSYTNAGNFSSSEFFHSTANNRENSTQCYFPLPSDIVPRPIIRLRIFSEGKSFQDKSPKISEKPEDLLVFELISGSKQHLSQLVQYLKNSINR